MYHPIFTSLSSMWSNLSAAAKAPSPIIVLFPAKQKCFHFLFSQQPKLFLYLEKLFTLYFDILVEDLNTCCCFKITKFSPVNAPAPASASSGAWKEIELFWCSCCDKENVMFLLWQGWCDFRAVTKMVISRQQWQSPYSWRHREALSFRVGFILKIERNEKIESCLEYSIFN